MLTFKLALLLVASTTTLQLMVGGTVFRVEYDPSFTKSPETTTLEPEPNVPNLPFAEMELTGGPKSGFLDGQPFQLTCKWNITNPADYKLSYVQLNLNNEPLGKYKRNARCQFVGFQAFLNAFCFTPSPSFSPSKQTAKTILWHTETSVIGVNAYSNEDSIGDKWAPEYSVWIQPLDRAKAMGKYWCLAEFENRHFTKIRFQSNSLYFE